MRKKCALLLEQRLANELADLNMNRANFVVSITSPEFANEDSTDIKGITRNGLIQLILIYYPGTLTFRKLFRRRNV